MGKQNDWEIYNWIQTKQLKHTIEYQISENKKMAANIRENKCKRIPVGNLIENNKIIPPEKCKKELKIYNQYRRKRKNQHQSSGINTRRKIIF